MCPATLLMFPLLYKQKGLSSVPSTHINSAVSNMNYTSSSSWVGMIGPQWVVLFWNVVVLYRVGPSKRKYVTTGLTLKITHTLWYYSVCSAQLESYCALPYPPHCDGLIPPNSAPIYSSFLSFVS